MDGSRLSREASHPRSIGTTRSRTFSPCSSRIFVRTSEMPSMRPRSSASVADQNAPEKSSESDSQKPENQRGERHQETVVHADGYTDA